MNRVAGHLRGFSRDYSCVSVVVGGGGIVAGEGGSGVYEVTGENRPIFVESDVFYSLDDLI